MRNCFRGVKATGSFRFASFYESGLNKPVNPHVKRVCVFFLSFLMTMLECSVRGIRFLN